MCGLVGVMKRDLGLGEVNRFRDLYTVAQLRGDDGAGMFVVPRAGPNKPVPLNGKHGIKTARTTWSSGHLVTTKEFYDAIKCDASIMVGHARQPTRGGSTLEMVHPHRAGHIIMVHNGTMNYVNGNSLKTGESDSKAICRALFEGDPQKFVQNSYGAYALIWVDLEKQTLNFLRNDERPLWFCEEKDTMVNGQVTTLWWASEPWMMTMTLSRYPSYNKDKMRVFQLPKNEHWSFPLDVDYFLNEATVEKCEKKYSVSTYNDGAAYGYGGYNGRDAWEAWDDATPFVGGTTKNTKTETSTALRVIGTSDKSDQFSYIPPEHRQTTGERLAAYPSVVLKSSKANADLASAKATKKEDVPQADFFRKDLSFFQVKNYVEAVDLINAGPCCWCSTSPPFVSDVTPKIYPVRFSADKKDYICHECLKDEDAQRMLGIDKVA